MNVQQVIRKVLMRKSWHRLIAMFVVLFIAAVIVLWFVRPQPQYKWSLVVPSPDNQHLLIVLRGDAAAFADFSYRIYVFPKLDVPALKPAGTPQLLTWPWRSDKYLVYDGFAYPMFRWTSKKSVEIDFNEASPGQAPVDSIFSIGVLQNSTVISFKSGVENVANSVP